MRIFIILVIFSLTLQSCFKSIYEPKLGNYRAEMITKDGSILPFKFELLKVSNQLTMKVKNDKETLLYDQIEYEGDSIRIYMHPFDAVIIAKAEDGFLKGRYLKEESGKETPFKAIISDAPKFESSKKANLNLNGKA